MKQIITENEARSLVSGAAWLLIRRGSVVFSRDMKHVVFMGGKAMDGGFIYYKKPCEEYW